MVITSENHCVLYSEHVMGLVDWGKVWTVAWAVIRAAATTGSTSGVWYSQFSNGH